MKKFIVFFLFVAAFSSTAYGQIELKSPDGYDRFAVSGQETMTVKLENGSSVTLEFDVFEGAAEGTPIEYVLFKGIKMTHPSHGRLSFEHSYHKYDAGKQTVRFSVGTNEAGKLFIAVSFYPKGEKKTVIKQLVAPLPMLKGDG